MRDLIAGFQASVLWLGVVGFLSLAGIWLFCAGGYALVRLRKLFGRSKVQGLLTAFVVVCAVMYGGSKGTRNVNFPRTDIEVSYLVDAGSYVTNDLVHVAFYSYMIPSSEQIILSYWPDGSTNEEDMVTALAAPLADFPNPLDLPFENAISNRWYCYTTWTPGPAVRTNGVWQTIWMMDRRDSRYLIPIRTWIEVDGDVIAPTVFTIETEEEEEGDPDDE